MTLQSRRIESPAPVTTRALKARFAPLFARIAEGALRRERGRILPFEEISWLKEAGFTALRVPVEYGGSGVSLEQFFDLLVDLAAADTNIAQALRGHFALVEDRLVAPRAEGEIWLRRFGAGQIAGNAWSETGAVKLGETLTRLHQNGADLSVEGEKFYSTGTIYAEWIDTFVVREGDGAPVIAILQADQPGIERRDDWAGFGQRLTGTGTTTFKDAKLEPEGLIPFETRFRYQTALYQLVLNAVLAGAAEAALREIAKAVSQRKRSYSHGAAPRAAEDPQILQVIGRARAYAFGARAATILGARSADLAFETAGSGNRTADDEANITAELDSAAGQVVAAELALRATTDLFNALGASATDQALAFDRHWRNARTAASHNPLIYKERILGDHAVNGTVPPFIWQIGSVGG